MVLVLLFYLLINYFFERNIITPISKYAITLENNEDDLSIELKEEGSSEVRTIVRAINKFIFSLRETVGKIKSTVTSVNANTSKLENNANMLVESVKKEVEIANKIA